MNAVKLVGDQVTADLLEQVFKEEMGHVKHGLIWFNRWREQDQSEWESYRKLLKFPLNPQRAKGPIFCEDARRSIGFSESYIRELRAFNGSKGRPPALWLYNPNCDREILRGKPGLTPSAAAKKMSDDLQTVPTFLCQKTDIVVVGQKPSIEWIESLQNAGFETPDYIEFRRELNEYLAPSIQSPKLAGLEPWGWSPDIIELFKPLLSRLVPADGGNSEFAQSLMNHHSMSPRHLGRIFSKAWSVDFLNKWLEKHPDQSLLFGTREDAGKTYTQWNCVFNAISQTLKTHSRAMIKAPFGTSGMQVKQITQIDELDGPLGGWIRRILREQNEIIVEPYLNRISDLSIQLKIQENETSLLEVRQFITGSHHEYRGTLLGSKLFNLEPHALRFFYSAFKQWKKFLRDLGDQLRATGYRGPAGVDAFLWQTPEGAIRLKPLVELNPRWTMGRVALELEKKLIPGLNGAWAFLPLRELKRLGFKTPQEFAQIMQNKYPIQTEIAGGTKRIRSGVLVTNDPAHAKSVLTVLVTFPNPELLSNWQF
jgi:hypothetical protein